MVNEILIFTIINYCNSIKYVFVCLFVFYAPSTARSFRDGIPIYCPLQRT